MSTIEQYPERPLPECLYGTREFEERRNAKMAASYQPRRRVSVDVVEAAPFTGLRGAVAHYGAIRQRFAKAHVRAVPEVVPEPFVEPALVLAPSYKVWFAPAEHAPVAEAPAALPAAAIEIKPAITCKSIIGAVAAYYGLRVIDLISERRTSNVVKPRQVAMYLAKMLTTRSYPQIGNAVGGRDHTTAMHAVRRIEAMLPDDAVLAADVDHLTSALQGEFALITRELQPPPALDPWPLPNIWSQSERDDILSLKGVMTSAEIAKRYGCTRGAISGLWYRAAKEHAA